MPTSHETFPTKHQIDSRRLDFILTSTSLSCVGQIAFQELCDMRPRSSTSLVTDAKRYLLQTVLDAIKSRHVKAMEKIESWKYSPELRAKFVLNVPKQRERLVNILEFVGSLDDVTCLALFVRLEAFWAVTEPEFDMSYEAYLSMRAGAPF